MASLREVAKLAGVSTATVSNVLNGRNEKVSEGTRARVLEAVRELRYRPTALAKDQRAIPSRTIGVLIPDVVREPISSNVYNGQILDGALEIAIFRGYHVTIYVERLWDDVDHAIRRTYDGRCDGLLLVAPPFGNRTAEALLERGTPLAFVGSTAHAAGISSVDVDNDAVGRLAARELLAHGHRRFAFVGSHDRIVSAFEREFAFRDELRKAGIPDAATETRFFSDERKDERAIVAEWIARGSERPTAVFAWNSQVAISFMRHALEAGLTLPRDLSVIGVDDDERVRSAPVPLTTVAQPLQEIARRAATILIERIEAPDRPDEIVLFSPELVRRSSVAAPPTVFSRSAPPG